MKTATDAPHNDLSSGQQALADLQGKYVCPFCGTVNDRADIACPRCTLRNTQSVRQATRARLGPWYVLQTRNPAAPGMDFRTLLALVKSGRVTAQSIVRGPTTDQLWRFAAAVKGLSREFGLCYGCGADIPRTATICHQCQRLQEPPMNPDVLLESPVAAGVTTVQRQDVSPVAASARPPASLTRAKTTPPPRHRPESPVSPAAQTMEPADLAGRKAEGILSASELAAAFQLDFAPTRRRWRQAIGGVLRGTVKVVLVLLLFAAAGFAVVLYLDRELRRETLDWSRQSWESAREYTTGQLDRFGRKETADEAPAPRAPAADPPRPPEPRVVPLPPPQPSDVPATAAEAVAATPPDGSPDPEDPAVAAEAADSAAQAAPVERAPAPQQNPAVVDTAPQAPRQPAHEADRAHAPDRDAATDGQESAVAGRTAPAADQRPSQEALPEEEPTDRAQAAQRARTLWRQAIDAEAGRDFAEAVGHYEQIKRLPRSVWPAGLELRLEAARGRVE